MLEAKSFITSFIRSTAVLPHSIFLFLEKNWRCWQGWTKNQTREQVSMTTFYGEQMNSYGEKTNNFFFFFVLADGATYHRFFFVLLSLPTYSGIKIEDKREFIHPLTGREYMLYIFVVGQCCCCCCCCTSWSSWKHIRPHNLLSGAEGERMMKN